MTAVNSTKVYPLGAYCVQTHQTFSYGTSNSCSFTRVCTT